MPSFSHVNKRVEAHLTCSVPVMYWNVCLQAAHSWLLGSLAALPVFSLSASISSNQNSCCAVFWEWDNLWLLKLNYLPPILLPSPLLLPRSYAETRLIRQRENVESSEEALNPDCPIFAATEKRYYPYSPGVPVDPTPTSLFLCQFQQPSLALALCSDHKHLHQLLVEITCHMRRAKAKHNLFSSFLFFWKTRGNGAPYSHENLLGAVVCNLMS